MRRHLLKIASYVLVAVICTAAGALLTQKFSMLSTPSLVVTPTPTPKSRLNPGAISYLTQNTTPLPANTSSPTTTTVQPTSPPSNTLSTPAANWLIYTNGTSGVQFSYPAAATLDTALNNELISSSTFMPNATPVIGLRLPSSAIPDATLDSLFLISSAASTANACDTYTISKPQALPDSLKAGSILYKSVTLKASAYGVSTETRIFHTFANNRCYEVSQAMYYTAGSSIPQSFWDLNHQILSTLQFIATN